VSFATADWTPRPVPGPAGSLALSCTASLAALDEAVSNEPGVLLVTGGRRTGKTLLLETFARRAHRDGSVVEAVRVAPDALDACALREAVRRVRERLAGRSRALVLIDDAHMLPRAALEELARLWTSDALAGARVHVLLAGLPGLATRLDGALASRITLHCQLPPAPLEHRHLPGDVDRRASRWWRFPGADLVGAVLGAVAFLAAALGVVAYGTPPRNAPRAPDAGDAVAVASAHAVSSVPEPGASSSVPASALVVDAPAAPARPTAPAAREDVREERPVTRPERPNRSHRLELPPRAPQLPARSSEPSSPPLASSASRPGRIDRADDPAAVIDWLVNHAAASRRNATR
jgi:hypothetical protein